MILISLSPYVVRKIGLLLLGLVCLGAISCFATESMFLSVGSTPYDQQMSRIRPVLLEAASSARQNVSLGLVNQWIGDLRGIPYGYSPEWKTPDEVYHGPAADCKGKAVALYERMRSRGAENIRLVIGKRTATSRRTHAWLEWKTANGTYILDPTINCSAFTSGQTGNKSYLPLYAYSGNRKYRAADISLYAQN